MSEAHLIRAHLGHVSGGHLESSGGQLQSGLDPEHSDLEPPHPCQPRCSETQKFIERDDLKKTAVPKHIKKVKGMN